MNRIKENNLIATIPESDTIQYVLTYKHGVSK